MPWTLYRYILKDLLKVLLLSGAVLVLVISFAAAIKPLSDGVLGPGALVKYILYTMPTTLTLVVPFAGAFAATLVFSRLAADNEIVACCASGMSYFTILLPVFFLGFVLTVSLYVLSNATVPWYFQKAARLAERDLGEFIVRRVRDRKIVQIDDWRLWADNAKIGDPPAEAQETDQPADTLIMLRGVVLGQYTPDEQVRQESIAEAADIYLRHTRQGTRAWVRLVNAVAWKPGSGNVIDGRTDQMSVGQQDVRDVTLPTPHRDDPRFLTRAELHELVRNPDRYLRVRERKIDLAYAIASERVLSGIERALTSPAGSHVIHLDGQDGHAYELRAPRVTRSENASQIKLKLLAAGDQPVVARSSTAGQEVTGPEAALWLERVPGQVEQSVIIEFKEATIRDLDLAMRTSAKKEWRLPRMTWPKPVAEELMKLDSEQLMGVVGPDDPPLLRKEQAGLRYQLEKLRRKVVAQVSERAALAAASLLVLMLGAVLSVKMRGSMPLVIYFWSFLLAAFTVFITRSGENLTSDPKTAQALGLCITWSGNAILLAVIAGIYFRTARN